MPYGEAEMKTFAPMMLATALAIPGLSVARAVPPEGSPLGPSATAVRQVESRRKALAQFEGVDPDLLRPNERAAVLGKMGPALTELAESLASGDSHVYTSAVVDLTNGYYRAFPKGPLLEVLLPALKTPETSSERMVSQSFIMQYLAARYGSKAKAALPDVLKMVVNDKLSSYLRGQAIDAAAKIGTGDAATVEAVVKAFVAAIESPHPKSESGVQDRAAQHLGQMGKAALPAKEALQRLFARGSWNEDPALEALGKIAQDDPARPLADYLRVLESLGKAGAEKVSLEQAAVAFHHVVSAAKTGKKYVSGSPPREEEVIDREAAMAIRPVLLAIVERGKDDAYFRAALRALTQVGAGSSPRAATAFADSLVRTGSSEAVQALERLEPTDAKAVAPLTAAFGKSVSDQRSWHISYHLAQTLARYGKAARPAVPEVIRALRAFRASPNVGDAYAEQFAVFLQLLAVAGREDDGARRLVVDLLDPASEVMKRSAPDATPEYHVHLLLTLATLGLPKEGKQRQAALGRIREGLASDVLPVFSAAAQAVVAVRPLTDNESPPLVPLLARTLTPKFAFRKAHERIRNRLPTLAAEELGQVPALRALAALGKAAREALPAVKAIADRPLIVRRSSFLPEPSVNALIREGRKAVGAIE
jgi:hypothetical protein